MTVTVDTGKGVANLVQAGTPTGQFVWFRQVDNRTPATLEFVGVQTGSTPVVDLFVPHGIEVKWQVFDAPTTWKPADGTPSGSPVGQETLPAPGVTYLNPDTGTVFGSIIQSPSGFVAPVAVESLTRSTWESTSHAYAVLGRRERVVNVGWGAMPREATFELLPRTPQDRQNLLYVLAQGQTIQVRCATRDAIDQFPALPQRWVDEPSGSHPGGQRRITLDVLSLRLDHRNPSPSNKPYPGWLA